eukprot:6058591-Pleurochrysis_carterae.AAC.4
METPLALSGTARVKYSYACACRVAPCGLPSTRPIASPPATPTTEKEQGSAQKTAACRVHPASRWRCCRMRHSSICGLLLA